MGSKSHFCFESNFFSVSPCKPGPCKNGGTCTMTGANSYSCKCTDEFEGATCEKRKRTYDMTDLQTFLKIASKREKLIGVKFSLAFFSVLTAFTDNPLTVPQVFHVHQERRRMMHKAAVAFFLSSMEE